MLWLYVVNCVIAFYLYHFQALLCHQVCRCSRLSEQQKNGLPSCVLKIDVFPRIMAAKVLETWR